MDEEENLLANKSATGRSCLENNSGKEMFLKNTLEIRQNADRILILFFQHKSLLYRNFGMSSGLRPIQGRVYKFSLKTKVKIHLC